APWCHTCLSMRAFVFPDAALRPLAPSFVWLAIDTEREENAPVGERLGAKVLPTLYVIDAATEGVRLAHPGSLTAAELTSLLDPLGASATGATGATRATGAPGATGATGAPGAKRPAGNAAVASPEAIAEHVTRLADSKQLAGCVTAGADEAPRM